MLCAYPAISGKFKIPETHLTSAFSILRTIYEHGYIDADAAACEYFFQRYQELENKKNYNACLTVIEKLITEINDPITLTFAWGMKAEYLCRLKKYNEALKICDYTTYMSDHTCYVYYVKAIAWAALHEEAFAKGCLKKSAQLGFPLAQELALAYNLNY